MRILSKRKIEFMKAKAEAETADALKRENVLKERELELEREKFEAEQKTKDRADVSLNEYKELLKENENLKERVSHLNSVLDKFFNPLANLNIPQEIVQKMLDGKFKTIVRVYEKPEECGFTINVSYIIDRKDFGR